jgi:hypothetical protein
MGMAEIKDQIRKKDILEAISKISLRMEQQSNETTSKESFVPAVVDFAKLASSNTYIIYGRNGTGKTHILKAFSQHCHDNYEEVKILPVYIDFRDLDLGAALSSISANDLIRRFYRNFLNKIGTSLEECANKIISVSLLERLFKRSSAVKKARMQQSIKRLKTLLEPNQVTEALDKYTKSETFSRDSGSKIEGGINMGGKISSLPPKAEIGASSNISANIAKNEKETIDLIYKGLEVIDYEAIRNELETLIQIYEANAIVILVDEWHSVDLSIQPLLAEMIRRTIGTSNKIFLKIATLEYLTRTSAPRADSARQRIGWQAGIDITTLVDLDSFLNYDAYKEGVEAFLSHVAYNHVCLALPSLKASFHFADFKHYLGNELFETPAIYSEVMRASEGNPRDFLILLLACCSTAQAYEQKISLEQVITAVSTHFGDKYKTIAESPGTLDVYIRLFNEIVQKRSKLFLLSTQKAESNEKIRELWHYRFIHLVKKNLPIRDEDGVLHEYSVYSMDYGKLLELKLDIKEAEVVNKMLATVDFLPNVLGDASSSSRIALSRLISSSKTSDESISAQMLLNGQKRALIREMGIAEVAKAGGIEPSNIDNINYLTKHCVLDRLLD